MALVSLSCFLSPLKSRDALGGAVGFGSCASGAGVFATVGVALIAAFGAGVVTGAVNGVRAGRNVNDVARVMAGCDARAVLAAGGGDGAMCPRAAQAFIPRIAAATRQIWAADISFSIPHPSYGSCAIHHVCLSEPRYRHPRLDAAI